MTGFKLVLPHVSITSARPDEIVVSNLYPVPKVALNRTPSHIGILRLDLISGPTYSIGSITTWYPLPHGYDYVPTVFAVWQTVDSTVGGIFPFAIGALGEIFMDADEKNVNLKFESFIDSPLPERHLLIRYYIFAEQGLDT